MFMTKQTRFAVAAAFTLAAMAICCGQAFAERAIVQVTPGEYRRLGYQDKDEFMELYTQCVQVAKDLKKRNVCADDDCVKKSPPWQDNGCEKHATTIYYLTSIDPPRYPVSEIFDNAERANYVRLYTASCQDGFKAMNPGGDVALVKNTCECAASQSLDLIEYSDYKAFESTSASKEVIERVKNRAAYARFICENKPAVWREQSVDIGASVAGKAKADPIAFADKANLADGRLTGMFEQLKTQGAAYYGSLLAKLNAEAKTKSCVNDQACSRVNESFGAIYKDILYVAYAVQIYKTTDEVSRPAARGKLNEFVKVALLSIDPNLKLIRTHLNDSPAGKADRTLLSTALRDAEECRKLMTAISRELENR